MLQLKFGPAHEAHAARMAAASSEELECWIERVLTAVSIEDVFEG